MLVFQGEVAVRSREKRKKKEQKSGAYGRFVKTATLRSGRLEQEEAKDEEQDEKLPKRARLTDEELFKACGGLTAHKYEDCIKYHCSWNCSALLKVFILESP